jgi:hypothetical protein
MHQGAVRIKSGVPQAAGSRTDSLLNIRENKREIPLIMAGQHRHGPLDAFLRWVLVVAGTYIIQWGRLSRQALTVSRNHPSKSLAI